MTAHAVEASTSRAVIDRPYSGTSLQRGKTMLLINRILCPVDFFPASDKAVQYAADLAADYGGKIHLLHVVSPAIPIGQEYAINTAEIMNSIEEASKSQMKKLVADLKAREVDVTSEVRTGNVHQVIEEVISAVKPDLIVMGSDARSRIERFFMGSVAEWLTRNSPVPVLVISGKYRSAKGRKRPEKRVA